MKAPVLFAAGSNSSRVTVLIVTADIGSKVTLWRQFGSSQKGMLKATPEVVRGCKDLLVESAEQLFVDYEIPQGCYMQYWVEASDGTETITSPKVPTGPYDFGNDALFDLGNPRRGMLVSVEAFSDYKYGISRDVQRVWGRRDPVVISGVREMFTATLNLLTMTLPDRDKLLAIVENGSTIAMSVRSPQYGLEGVLYFAVGDVREIRLNGAVASEPDRRWALDVQQVTPPPAEYRLPSYALTWGELAERSTWGEIADLQWWEAVAQ